MGEAAEEPGQNGAQAKLKAQQEPIPEVVEVERAGGTPACIPSNALGEWGVQRLVLCPEQEVSDKRRASSVPVPWGSELFGLPDAKGNLREGSPPQG